MMVPRFCLVFLLSLMGAAVAQTQEEMDACGPLPQDSSWTQHYLACHAHPDTGTPFWAFTGIRAQDGSTWAYQWNRRLHQYNDMCYPGGNSTTNQLSYSAALGNSTGAATVWTSCPLYITPPAEEDPPPGTPPGAGWDCDTYNDGSQFCWKYEDDVWYVSWQTRCGVFYGETMDPSEGEQWAADFDASRDDVCDNPLPTDPEAIECIGADGLACESTLQEVLYELRMMRHAEATPPVPPAVHDIELDLGEVTVPSFDRDDPTWEGWVEPDFTELEQDTLTARVQSGVVELRSLAETKFPFGMVTWVPTGDVAGAGSCDDPQIALMGTDARGIGWCDSAMELFLAGFGRAALAVLMTIGFGFGVVRTVSLS